MLMAAASPILAIFPPTRNPLIRNNRGGNFAPRNRKHQIRAEPGRSTEQERSAQERPAATVARMVLRRVRKDAIMPSFFEKRDPWGHGFALWVVVAFAFAAPLGFWALQGLKLDNDVQTWLPEHDREARVFAWLQEHFPEDHRIIISWEGSTLKDPRISRLAERLRGPVGADGIRRGGSPYVQEVFTPQNALSRMVNYGVPEEEALDRLKGVLIGTGWMKVRMTDAGRADAERTIEEIVRHCESRLGVKLRVHPAVTHYTDDRYFADMDARAQEEIEVPTPIAGEIPAHDFQISWEGIQPGSKTADDLRRTALAYRGFATYSAPSGRQLIDDCFFAPGSPIAVVVSLSEAGTTEPEIAVASVIEAAEECGIPAESLHLGGRTVTTAALNQSVRRAAWNPEAPPGHLHKRSVLLLSALVGLALALLCLKSFRLGVLVIGTAWYATAISIAVVPLSGSTMNMVLVVLPSLLMVLALSAAIHVANYWKHAAYENPRTAVREAMRLARRPCVMAALTTAIGMATLCTSSLTPVRDFGIFSALGTLIMLGVVLFGLPALLQIWRAPRPSASEIDHRLWRAFGLSVYRRWPIYGGTCIAICLVATWGLKWFETETKVIRYFPGDSKIVQDYQFLEESLSGITPIDVVVRFDSDMQQRTKFLERMEIVRAVADKIREHESISGAISLADFQPVTIRPDSGPSNRRALLKYFKQSHAVERAVREDSEAGSADFFKTAGKAAGLTTPDDAALNAAGDELWRISAQASVMSDVNYGDLTSELNELVQSVTRYHPGASHVVTGTVPLFLRTQEAVLESLIVSFGMAFAIIAAVMMWTLKDVWAGLLSMIPNLLPVSMVFGSLAWFGQRVDVGTMITASIALGIAVDGTLHLLTWFRDGLERGHSRMRSVVDALAHCGPAMLQTSAAVSVGMLMLAPADLLLISRFGWLMASLITAALVADLVILPSLLAGWLGALIERRVKAGRKLEQQMTPAMLAALRGPHFARSRGSAQNVPERQSSGSGRTDGSLHSR